MYPSAADRMHMTSLVARADEPAPAANSPNQDVPWLWIVLAFAVALGILLGWVAWGRRFPPPGQPWR